MQHAARRKAYNQQPRSILLDNQREGLFGIEQLQGWPIQEEKSIERVRTQGSPLNKMRVLFNMRVNDISSKLRYVNHATQMSFIGCISRKGGEASSIMQIKKHHIVSVKPHDERWSCGCLRLRFTESRRRSILGLPSVISLPTGRWYL